MGLAEVNLAPLFPCTSVDLDAYERRLKPRLALASLQLNTNSTVLVLLFFCLLDHCNCELLFLLVSRLRRSSTPTSLP